MNAMQRRVQPAGGLRPALIRWRGKSYTIAEANALAVQEQFLGNLQVAANLYGLILTRLPDCAEVYNNRGAIWQTMGRYEDAMGSYDQALALKPD
jgi:tetratricopeptide (TPR) repeat protein